MKFIKHILQTITIGILFFVSACANNSEVETTPNIVKTAEAIAGTMVAVQLTSINEELTQSAATVIPDQSPQLPTDTPEPVVNVTLTDECLAAQFVSEEITDGTVMIPGDKFSQTWWFRNVGSCAWTEEFSLVYHHGPSMGALERMAFPGFVAPGEAIPLSVNMVAPSVPGRYQSFWTLESSDGLFFGPSANGTFWVLIEIPGPTPTSRPHGFSGIGSSARSDGKVENSLKIGDEFENLAISSTFSFNLNSIPFDAVITKVLIDLDRNYNLQGDPFNQLGCLQIFDLNTGGLMWNICTESLFASGGILSTAEGISSIENGKLRGSLDISLSFEIDSNVDGQLDQINMNQANLFIYWYTP